MGTRISLTNRVMRRSLPLVIAVALLVALCLGRGATPAHAAAATLTIDTTTDGDVRNAVLTLHESIKLATGTLAVGALTSSECALVSNSTFSGTCSTTDTIGSGSADLIVFKTATFPPDTPATIALTANLPALSTGSDTISGVGAGVIVDGFTLDCFLISGEGSDSNVIQGLEMRSCPNDGVEISGGADQNTIGGSNAPESGGQCTNTTDDDGDGYRNDGCASVGSAEGMREELFTIVCPLSLK